MDKRLAAFRRRLLATIILTGTRPVEDLAIASGLYGAESVKSGRPNGPHKVAREASAMCFFELNATT